MGSAVTRSVLGDPTLGASLARTQWLTGCHVSGSGPCLVCACVQYQQLLSKLDRGGGATRTQAGGGAGALTRVGGPVERGGPSAAGPPEDNNAPVPQPRGEGGLRVD